MGLNVQLRSLWANPGSRFSCVEISFFKVYRSGKYCLFLSIRSNSEGTRLATLPRSREVILTSYPYLMTNLSKIKSMRDGTHVKMPDGYAQV